MELELRWPFFEEDWYPINFFIGGWHPSEDITIRTGVPPASVNPLVMNSGNWFLISNRSPLHPDQPGLIHRRLGGPTSGWNVVAFSGYVLDPPVHSWSSSEEILRFWSIDGVSQPNGVFATARISESGRTLELITDAFGMAPLYYREADRLILFGTNPRFLVMQGDTPDMIAWRCLLQSGFICGDRSLSSEVKRVPPAHILKIDPDDSKIFNWYDFSKLPDGTKEINNAAVVKVEEAFQSAMDRCLKLKGDTYFLPLSSGYDSRRILVSLISREASFETTTVRVLSAQGIDLDARFTQIMAKDLGFPHQIVELPNALAYARDSRQRRILLDAESREHTWAVPLWRALPKAPLIILDGLAGDVLGNSGFVIDGLHKSTESDRSLITNYAIGNAFDGLLNSEEWPTAEDVRNDLDSFIASLPYGMNQAELAHLLLRTRRAVAIWSQQMLPAGNVTIFPYLDLDYVAVTLAYNPDEKYKIRFPRTCLERYWPLYYSYPGTRRIPKELSKENLAPLIDRNVVCAKDLLNEIEFAGGIETAEKYLSKKGRFRIWCARKNNFLLKRWLWAIDGVLELVARQILNEPCWKTKQTKTGDCLNIISKQLKE